MRHDDGSPEHYHHFLLGFFVPLVYHLSTDWSRERFDRLLVRSCGPLDRLIREFGDSRIEIVEKSSHHGMARDLGQRREPADSTSYRETHRFVTIHGCDHPAAYDAVKFGVVRDRLLSMESIRGAVRAVEARWPRHSGPRILLIERGPSLAYYLSADADRKNSGAERRSIANHEALYRALHQDFPGCLNIRTETLTLAEQVALFSSADIIIAQHGAALANLIWARPTATVVEIFPTTARLEQRARYLFYFLACSLGLRYFKVAQQDRHSAVDVEAVRGAVARAVAASASPLRSRLRAGAFAMLRTVMSIHIAGRDQFLRARSRGSHATQRVAQRSTAR
jgi:hypothetical protein